MKQILVILRRRIWALNWIDTDEGDEGKVLEGSKNSRERELWKYLGGGSYGVHFSMEIAAIEHGFGAGYGMGTEFGTPICMVAF